MKRFVYFAKVICNIVAGTLKVVNHWVYKITFLCLPHTSVWVDACGLLCLTEFGINGSATEKWLSGIWYNLIQFSSEARGKKHFRLLSSFTLKMNTVPQIFTFLHKNWLHFFHVSKTVQRRWKVEGQNQAVYYCNRATFFLNQSWEKRWKNGEAARIRRLRRAAHSVRKVFRAGKFLRGVWWKNHVMPIAATVTLALPARFLCRTAQKKWEAQKATAC